ncbi:MAG: gliding motility-associated C-terminal domain-containing protein [Bacteroidota bacterium]
MRKASYTLQKGLLKGLTFYLFFFVMYSHAQIAKSVSTKGNENLKLSGIYSSIKKDNFKNTATELSTENKSANSLPPDLPVNNPYYKEAIEKRTASSRTFEDGRGGVIIKYSSIHINYLDKEQKYQPISASLSSVPSLEAPGQGLQWAALQQLFPTHLYMDGSTALSSDEKTKIIFNQNCKINEREISLSDFTVGEQGMLISSVIDGIDKKIIFQENRIETDYVIRKPMDIGNGDLIISEEIELPDGYYFAAAKTENGRVEKLFKMGRGGEAESFVVFSVDNKEQARFNMPFFYDANGARMYGKYNLIQQGGENILQIIIPGKWLKDINRVYPITIDPLVTGPISNFPPIYMNSCQFPTYEKDSMLVTIPADITITSFIVMDSYFADLFATPTPTLPDGIMRLSTVCGAVTFSCTNQTSPLPGTCYLVPGQDLKLFLACCFTPSCSDQTFYLTHGLARSNLGPGCNQTYIYYSPVSLLPPYPTTTFSAYIVGNTVETTQVEWSVTPASICSDVCTVTLEVTTDYGVPPYTITHPWAIGSSQYGIATGSCSSEGTAIIPLTIPNCPSTCGANSTLNVPPPVIVDACGTAVNGLSPKTISIKPVPVATANVTNVCSQSPLSIPVTSCVTGSSFQWSGSNGSSGTGNINDVVINPGTAPILVDYSVIPTANGCVGQAMSVSAEINPLPVIIGDVLTDTIDPGVETQLSATGGLTYQWTPATALSCLDCPDPLAAPIVATDYYVTGTNEYGCSDNDTVSVFVNQKDEVLYIPNSFSPNENDLNDLFCVYGYSIKKINIKIYDRWGQLVFQTSDMQQGWDGKHKGVNVEGGVYVYAVSCEWMSGDHVRRNGIVTVLR